MLIFAKRKEEFLPPIVQPRTTAANANATNTTSTNNNTNNTPTKSNKKHTIKSLGKSAVISDVAISTPTNAKHNKPQMEEVEEVEGVEGLLSQGNKESEADFETHEVDGHKQPDYDDGESTASLDLDDDLDVDNDMLSSPKMTSDELNTNLSLQIKLTNALESSKRIAPVFVKLLNESLWYRQRRLLGAKRHLDIPIKLNQRKPNKYYATYLL